MTALLIANTQIRQDAAGRFCLNDLHQASGGAKRHQPSDWLRLKQTQELIAEVVGSPDELRESPELNPIETTEGRYGGGTYAVKELVYAYAMWISAAFHLHVIRAYDAMVTAQRADLAPPLPLAPQHRADQFVSAGRIFAAAMRTARALRLSPAQAVRSAVACATRHTGINLAEEMDVDLDAVAARPVDTIATAIAEWATTRNDFTTADAITGAGLGNPGDRALQMRVAEVLHTLHFTNARRDNRRVWRRSLNA